MGCSPADQHRPQQPPPTPWNTLNRILRAFNPRWGAENYMLLLLPPAFALNVLIIKCCNN